MALETIKCLKEIGGFEIIRKEDRPVKSDGSVDWDEYDELRKTKPIAIDDDINTISFRMQKGAIKENGVNGCQVDTLIETAKIIINELNFMYPCVENADALLHLEKALGCLELIKKKE